MSRTPYLYGIGSSGRDSNNSRLSIASLQKRHNDRVERTEQKLEMTRSYPQQRYYREKLESYNTDRVEQSQRRHIERFGGVLDVI